MSYATKLRIISSINQNNFFEKLTDNLKLGFFHPLKQYLVHLRYRKINDKIKFDKNIHSDGKWRKLWIRFH